MRGSVSMRCLATAAPVTPSFAASQRMESAGVRFDSSVVSVTDVVTPSIFETWVAM